MLQIPRGLKQSGAPNAKQWQNAETTKALRQAQFAGDAYVIFNNPKPPNFE